MLLLCIGNKGIEIYAIVTCVADGNNLRVNPGVAAAQSYTKHKVTRSYPDINVDTSDKVKYAT